MWTGCGSSYTEATSITKVITYHMLLREVSPSRLSRSRQVPFSQVLIQDIPTDLWMGTVNFIIYGVLGRGFLPFPACTSSAATTDVEELEDDDLEVESTCWPAGGFLLLMFLPVVPS